MYPIVIEELSAGAILQIVEMDCSPLPKERDSNYLNFYRFFRDTCWVALHEGRVVGFAFGMVDQTMATHCYLNYLFVHGEYRKNGLGGRLMADFEASARRKGCEFVTLLTGKPENMAYYRKLGYETNHTTPPFTEEDEVYRYYFDHKKVSLLMKSL